MKCTCRRCRAGRWMTALTGAEAATPRPKTTVPRRTPKQPPESTRPSAERECRPHQPLDGDIHPRNDLRSHGNARRSCRDRDRKDRFQRRRTAKTRHREHPRRETLQSRTFSMCAEFSLRRNISQPALRCQIRLSWEYPRFETSKTEIILISGDKVK